MVITLLVQKLSNIQALEINIPQQPLANTIERDPLIAKGLQNWQYIGIFALAIASIFIVRIISPRIEHTILFAAALSVFLIVFFLSI